MDYTIEEKAMFMREALKEAEIALANDEIPIGCVLVKDGQIIGRGHNYGATNQKFGGAGSLYDILTDERLNHRVEVETGILEAECAAIMQTFFRQGRERKKQAKLAAKAETQE